MSKAFSLCSTRKEAEVLNVEVGFHRTVRSAIIKTLGENKFKKTQSQLDNEINQLISRAITSDKVIDILGLVGADKPDISILSDEFL